MTGILRVGERIRVGAADTEEAPAWALPLLESVAEMNRALAKLAGGEVEEEEPQAESALFADPPEPLNEAEVRLRDYQAARRAGEAEAAERRELLNRLLDSGEVTSPAPTLTLERRGWR